MNLRKKKYFKNNDLNSNEKDNSLTSCNVFVASNEYINGSINLKIIGSLRGQLVGM